MSIVVTFIIIIVVGIIYLITSAETNTLINELTEQEARHADIALSKALDEHRNEVYIRAKLMAGDSNVIAGIQNNDTDALKAIAENYMEGMDGVSLTDANGYVLARGHSDKTGDSIINQSAVAAALSTGEKTGTIESGAVLGLSARGSAPVVDADGKIIGAVVCSFDLSLNKYVDDIKERSNCEVSIYDGDICMNTTLTGKNGERAVGTRADSVIVDTVMRKRQDYQHVIELNGISYAANYSPLVVNGEVIGMLFAGVNIENALATRGTLLFRVLRVAVIAVVAATALLSVICYFIISKPLKKIGIFAEKIRSGELGLTTNSESSLDVRSADEIGVLARSLEGAYTQLRGYIGEIMERMQCLSEGDLVTESAYDFHGDFILIRDSVNGIIRNLNQTMGDVNSSTYNVSAVAKHIADGAQALAQGSTEQAAAIQQLSSSMFDIAEKTRANAEMATHAASLAAVIMGNAETGSRQMDEMMDAVRDINHASQSISRVINVIDEIAFQTNILALNAAVEAARAGQHGKGFAVVAEEVRSLAARSAEAAKETGSLIQNSMEKAELGARIADKTHDSLAGIVSGINESTKIVTEIARFSEEQAASIDQINTGIDQVTQVVHQNSATAQESAASAEEMSGQSTALEDLVSQFKLDNSMMLRTLPQPQGTYRTGYSTFEIA